MRCQSWRLSSGLSEMSICDFDFMKHRGKSSRDASVEMLRAVLMLGICIIHCACQSTYYYPWFGYVQNGTLWCVDGFVFLSGWYGIRFRVDKLLRLYGVGLASAMIGTLVADVWDGQMQGFYLKAWRVFCGYWFLHAYVVVMLFSPLINGIFDRGRSVDNDRQALIGCVAIAFLAFGWSYFPYLPVFNRMVLPQTSGLTAYSSFTLIGVYVVARTMRYFGAYRRLPYCCLWIVLGGALLLCACGGGEYNSPCAVVVSACVFGIWNHAGRMFRPNGVGERLVLFISPSIFSVYLIQMPFRSQWAEVERFLGGFCGGGPVCRGFGVVRLLLAAGYCVEAFGCCVGKASSAQIRQLKSFRHMCFSRVEMERLRKNTIFLALSFFHPNGENQET